MTRHPWITLATAVAGLLFTPTAMAQFAPRLVVDEASYSRGAATRTTEIEVVAQRNESSIAKITIYAPRGYTATLGHPTGAAIGTARAQVQARQIGENAILNIKGVVRNGDAANTQLQQQVAACTGTPTHSAIWLLALEAMGTPLTIPVAVDATGGPEAVFSTYKLQVCFTSPEIPQSAGGAPFGAKILDATLDLNRIFTNPAARGQAVWRGVFTPYVPNSGTPNLLGTVEARAFVGIPSSLTLVARYVARSNTYRLAGKLSSGGVNVAGERITILRGARAAVASLKSGGTVATNRSGAFRKKGSLRPRRTTFFLAWRAAHSIEESGGCASPAVLPVRCVTATVNDVFSPVRRVAPRRR